MLDFLFGVKRRKRASTRRRAYKNARQPCRKLKKSVCKGTPGCTYTSKGLKFYGCRGTSTFKKVVGAQAAPASVRNDPNHCKTLRGKAACQGYDNYSNSPSGPNYCSWADDGTPLGQCRKRSGGAARLDHLANTGKYASDYQGMLGGAPRVPRAYNTPMGGTNADLAAMFPGMFFGRRRVARRKGSRSKAPMKKLPASVRNMCRKLGIKTTRKVGNKRVYKNLTLLKRQIAKKRRSTRRRRTRRYTKINSKSPCGTRNKADCKVTPGCGYTSYKRKGRMIRGCKRKPVYRKRMVSRAAGFGW